MNTVVQAEPLTLGLIANLVDAVISTSSNMMTVAKLEITCLHTLNKISINGHSPKAINPDFLRVGEETTLIAA